MRARLTTALLSVLVLAACAHAPMTETHPSPPAIDYAPSQHPLRGQRLLLEANTLAAQWQETNGASWVEPISSTPQAHWLNSPEDLAEVPALVGAADRQDAMLVLVAYYVPNRGCTGFREGAPSAREYDQWIDQLIAQLGGTRAVIILEPDAVPAECFGPQRAGVLRAAVGKLVDAGQYVYIDAGHSAWHPSGETAQRLLDSGINRAEGFSVNVSNRQSTKDAHRWGRELADLVGDREFVIDTSRNGIGPPPDDPKRDDEWCNPQRQALGQPPTTAPGLPGVAALLWVKRPGESDGKCGGEDTYLFAPRQARNLIVNSPFVAEADREAAADAVPGPVE